jgi:putative Mg2+ transporter-C (MgtC) family protein
MPTSPPEFFVDPVYLAISLRLFAALLVGGLIGLERSFHGRPAGFRTHALVCLSTSLLMLITVYETRWFPGISQGRISLDPTRMAQGIMTGIGFLGAGTIMREGLSVRGLTTAASLWITAAIGILVGIGFFFPAVLASALTLGTLSLFRWIEARIPAEFYAHFIVRFARERALSEAEMRGMLKEHGFTVGTISYRLDLDANFFEYRMIIRSRRGDNAKRFADALSKLDAVKEFRVVPTGG